MIAQLPQQKVPFKDKLKVEWYKQTADYMINKALHLKDAKLTEDNIKAANGIIDSDTFNYVITPLKGVGDTTDITRNLPGQIRDVDFITPIKEKNIGEYLQLPYTFHVKVNNPDTVILRNKKLGDAVMAKMQEAFVNLVQAKQLEAEQANAGNPNQQPQQPQIPDFKQFADKFIKDYIDTRAINGQHRLNLLNDFNDFEYKRLLGFYYWWATEEFYTYRYIHNGNVYTDIISPLEGYPIDNGEEFIEDMDGFLTVTSLSFNQFVDKHRHRIDEKDWDYINDIISKQSLTEGPITIPVSHYINKYGDNFSRFMGEGLTQSNVLEFTDTNRVLKEYRIIYKTQTCIKILTYTNSIGEVLVREVDEEYTLDKANGDISIEEEWINEVFIQYRWGNQNNGLYSKPERLEVQRRDPKNRSICKLPHGGKRGIMNGMTINPIPRRLIPYLTIFRILTLHMERTIAKYKGSVILWPKNMLDDDDAGSLVDKYVMMMADSSLIYDNTEVDFNTVAQGVREVGISQAQSVERFLGTLLKLRAQVLEEAKDISNMNDAREGMAPSSATATTNSQNLTIAKLGSSLMIYVFNEALRREHQADLEFSKVAWVDGMTGTYTNKSTHEDIFVSIAAGEDFDTQWGIFVGNSKLDEQKLRDLQQIALASAQNDKAGLAGKIVAIDNIPELVKIIDEYDAASREFQSQMADKELQKEQMVQDRADARLKSEIESKEKIAQLTEDGLKERELIKQMGNDDGSANDLKGKELEEYLAIEKEKLRLKSRQLDILEKDVDVSHRLKEQDIQNKMTIKNNTRV